MPAMSENETELLKQFIREETERARKGTRATYLFGALAALCIGAYMGFILHMEKTFLEPENLAYVIRLQAEAAIPSIIQDTENAIVAQAENGANQISDRFLTLVPRMTAAGMEQIDMAYSDQIPYLSEEFAAIVREYIDQHGPALASFAAEHNSEEFADFFTREMMAELHRQLDAHLQESYEGRSLTYFKESITYTIMAMDQTVDQLLERNPEEMNRRERLQRRLLARLVALAIQSEQGPVQAQE